MSEVLASIDESKSMAAEAQGRGERGGLWAPKNRRGLIVGLGVVTLQQVSPLLPPPPFCLFIIHLRIWGV